MFDIWDRRAMAIEYVPGQRKRPGVPAVRHIAETQPVQGEAERERRSSAPPAAERGAEAYRKQQTARAPLSAGARVAARDVMTRPVTTLHEDATLAEALAVFTAHRFRHVPVVGGDAQAPKPVGMLSDRDLLRQTTTPQQSSRRVGEVMSSGLLSARPDTELRSLAQVMFTERVGALPVIETDGRIVGIVTRSDILRAVVELTPWDTWL